MFWSRKLDVALPANVPFYYIEKHVKRTFLVDTYHHKFNHGFRKNPGKNQAISQIIIGHFKRWDISKMFHQFDEWGPWSRGNSKIISTARIVLLLWRYYEKVVENVIIYKYKSLPPARGQPAPDTTSVAAWPHHPFTTCGARCSPACRGRRGGKTRNVPDFKVPDINTPEEKKNTKLM